MANQIVNKNHYFDWAATSPCDAEILRSALETTIEKWGNPSSVHTAGKEAREIFEDARKLCGKVLGVPAEKLYFTSGGTESDHIPILSVLNRPQKGHLLFSSIEHPAVREQALAVYGIHEPGHQGWFDRRCCICGYLPRR